jgi:ribosomal-protein-alanine N-acetyltransferase
VPLLATARLRLVPFEPAYLVTLFEAPELLAERFDMPAANGLRAFFVSSDVPTTFVETLRGSERPDPWSLGFALVEDASGAAVGTAGFKGPPTADGVVEIAYAVVPTREGRGIATKAVGALLRFAASDPRVARVRAHTLLEPSASTRVLEKHGFTAIGEVVDPEDGRVRRWERRPTT